MPALPPYIIEPVWQQFLALLPSRQTNHPLGCHRPRIPDRVVFEKLVQVLVFGCAYWRIADESCSATTLRRRRDEWIEAGVMDDLEEMARESYDRTIGLDLDSLRRREGGQEPGGQGKAGHESSVVVDAGGIPLGVISAPANRHDSPLLVPTLDALEALGLPPEPVSVHLDRGYHSNLTRRLLEDRGLVGVISKKGKPAPLAATKRWVVERTNSWSNFHKKLVWCTEKEGRVVDFWIAFSNVIIIVGRLIRGAWSRYRWETRPTRRP